jgi:hypothetical protein
LEVRLRCSDDNKLESDIGGGSRGWGFYGKSERLWFSSSSPDSDPQYVGFWASCQTEGGPLRGVPISVDIDEWHTYTIIWEPDNATFLVDGEIVAVFDNPPSYLMKVDIFLTNDRIHGPMDGFLVDYIEVPFNVSIQVDYVHVYVESRRLGKVSQHVLTLFSRANTSMSNTEGKGRDTIKLRDIYVSAHETWEKEGYLSYYGVMTDLEKILKTLEVWDEVEEKFSQANATIEDAVQNGMDDRTIKMMQAQLVAANGAWSRFDYEATMTSLEWILLKADEIPEPILLPILSIFGLILQSTLQCRRRMKKNHTA